MGVPKFYRWISERYPCLSEVITSDQIPEFDNLYFDMNGIIHGCSHPDDDDVFLRLAEEQIYADIFNYIDCLFGMIKPKKVFFMAVDGVAPRAKMNQQRARRFMSAKNAEAARKKVLRSGQILPSEKAFDSNCITPGTEFMARLHEQLCFFIKLKITTDPQWQGIRVYFSGHNCPGEGEHKIMDFIRYERSRSDYDPQTRHCLYGLDADLIMLGLCSHEPNFALLREEVKFGMSRKCAPKLKNDVESIRFHLLYLSLMRDYLRWEFHALEAEIPFDFNLESIIDDWVLMGFLVGNDFIPHLPHVHIHEDALPLLYAAYIKILPRLDGYLNENGFLNLKRFEVFLSEVSRNDKHKFMEQMDDDAYLASKRTKTTSSSHLLSEDTNVEVDLVPFEFNEDMDGENVELINCVFPIDQNAASSNIVQEPFPSASEILGFNSKLMEQTHDFDESQELLKFHDDCFENQCEEYWTPSIDRAFVSHKRNYYNEKLRYENISKEELRDQAMGYVRGIQWNLHYYYHGCRSWSWFYPHHYAPYISDIVNFADMEMHFDLDEPFHPFEQLLAVLPAESADCLPKALQELMLDPSSPISDFYPTEFETDLNGKKNDWEAVVLIPHINEKRLLDAVKAKLSELTTEEKMRNSHGPHLLFTHDSECDMRVSSILPKIFSDIENCSARMKEVDRNEFYLDMNAIVYGLLGVGLPEFPSMAHLPYTAGLEYAEIKVFQQPSRNQSMILKVSERPEMQEDIEDVACKLIGSEVYVNWPVIRKAIVHEIWTADKNYFFRFSNDGIVGFKSEILLEDERVVFDSYASTAHYREFVCRAISVEPQKAIVLVRLMSSSIIVFEERELVAKQQYEEPTNVVPVSLSLIIQDLPSKNIELPSLQEAYPAGGKVFITKVDYKSYGCCCTIIQNRLAENGTLVLALNLKPTNFYFDDLKRKDECLQNGRWMSSFTLSKILNCSLSAVGNLTSTFFVAMDDLPADEGRRNNGWKRFNIGLELKSNARKQFVPGYVRRSVNGLWSYSHATLVLLEKYKSRFPEVFACLEENFKAKYITLKAVFPLSKEKRMKRWDELREFLGSILPVGQQEDEGSSFVDPRTIRSVENRVQHSLLGLDVVKHYVTNSQAVFRSELCCGIYQPTPDTSFELLDRVVCVKRSYRAPFAEYGTVIGLSSTRSTVDVLFDHPFFSGKIIRSKRSCARLPVDWLINLTFGKRVRCEVMSDQKYQGPSHRAARADPQPDTPTTDDAKEIQGVSGSRKRYEKTVFVTQILQRDPAKSGVSRKSRGLSSEETMSSRRLFNSEKSGASKKSTKWVKAVDQSNQLDGRWIKTTDSKNEFKHKSKKNVEKSSSMPGDMFNIQATVTQMQQLSSKKQKSYEDVKIIESSSVSGPDLKAQVTDDVPSAAVTETNQAEAAKQSSNEKVRMDELLQDLGKKLRLTSSSKEPSTASSAAAPLTSLPEKKGNSPLTSSLKEKEDTTNIVGQELKKSSSSSKTSRPRKSRLAAKFDLP